MRNRILSLLLVLALVVTVSVFAVEAAGTAFDESTADANGVVTAYCDACKQDVQWTAATLADDGSLNVSEHVYIPSEGVTTSADTKNWRQGLCVSEWHTGQWIHRYFCADHRCC